ncbi:MAG: hypothetical protein JRN01_04675 [Nitrososphaerota archaeon]|nr:hypothetical protein [Nitrososphaerota archaeon]
MDKRISIIALLSILLISATAVHAATSYSLGVSTRYADYSGTVIPIAIFGSVIPTPPSGTNVSIYIYNPSGSVVYHSIVPLNSKGGYNITAQPQSTWATGSYLVKAEWALNNTTAPIVNTANFDFTFSVPWTIQSLYTNGVPAPGAAITIFQNGAKVFTGQTNSSGLLTVPVPDYPINVSATLDSYTGTATASSNSQIITVVIPQPAPPYGTQSISMSSTLITAGGFIIAVQNPPVGTTQTVRVTQAYDLPYLVNVENGLVSFSTNQTNFYTLNITFSFPGPAEWHQVTITEYSQLMGEKIAIPEYTFSKNVTLMINVESIVGPHYPTAQEIAAALTANESSLFQKFTNEVTSNVTKTVVPPIDSLNGQDTELTQSVKQLDSAMQSLSSYMTTFQGNLNQTINYWETNEWTTVAVTAAITMIFIFAVYYSLKHRKEEEITIDEVKNHES